MPSPIALFLIGVLLVSGLVFVKAQRWYSPRPEPPPPAERPTATGPDDGAALMTSPAIRVLIRASRQPQDEADDEGYPGRIQVIDRDGLHYKISFIDMETYVAHVITGELPPSWDGETKRAQAVAARSYAMSEWDPDELYDIRASSLAQNFRSEQTDAGAIAAAEATRGLALVQAGRVVRAFYHATCGGHTTTPRERWGLFFPRLAAVRCDYCSRSSLYRWSYASSLDDLSRRLGADVQDLWIEATDSSGRVDRVIVETADGIRSMSGDDFRAAVGFTNLRSTWFRIERGGVAVADDSPADDDAAIAGEDADAAAPDAPGDGGAGADAAGTTAAESILFEGRGSGHGVGLCQWGAHGMAAAGFTWTEILAHYYPGIDVQKLY